MYMPVNPAGKMLIKIITFIGIISLIAQFVLIIQNRIVGVPETILRFFCYFTILTNILVALTSWYQWRPAEKGISAFFRRPQTVAAVTLYIMVVFIVYNIALRGIVTLTGMNSIVNELLHVIIPILFLIYWIAFADKSGIKLRDAWAWMPYPFFYLAIVLILGAVLNSRFYPYPFLDAYNHGYQKVFISALVIMGLFFLLAFLFVLFARWSGRQMEK